VRITGGAVFGFAGGTGVGDTLPLREAFLRLAADPELFVFDADVAFQGPALRDYLADFKVCEGLRPCCSSCYERGGAP
jgi:hypothetical protein